MKRKWWFSALLTVVIVLGAAGLALMPAQARDRPPDEPPDDPPAPYSLTLAPASAEGPVPGVHRVVATVMDRDRTRMERVEVSLVVRGPEGVITRTAVTDRRGEAHFSWTRTLPGTDTAVAFVGHLTARATVEWFVPAPDPVVTSLVPDRIFLESSLPPAERLPVILTDPDGDGETIEVHIYISGRNLPIDPAAFTFSPAHGITCVHVWRLDEENIVVRLAFRRDVPLGRKELLIAPEGAARMVSTGLYLHVYRSLTREEELALDGQILRHKWNRYRYVKDPAQWAKRRPPEYSEADWAAKWAAEAKERQAEQLITIMRELDVLPRRPREMSEEDYNNALRFGLRTALEAAAEGVAKSPIPLALFPVMLELYKLFADVLHDPTTKGGEDELTRKLLARRFTRTELGGAIVVEGEIRIIPEIQWAYRILRARLKRPH